MASVIPVPLLINKNTILINRADGKSDLEIRGDEIDPDHVYKKIGDYFKQFGKISDAVGMPDLIFVVYEMENSFIEAIQTTEHRINNKIYKVYPAMHWYQPEMADISTLKLSKIPEITTPSILEYLNDDCLFEIFKHLSLRDLCAACDVSKKFKARAEEMFSLHFTDLNIIVLYAGTFSGVFIKANNDLLFDGSDSMTLIKSLFRNFGVYIKSIRIMRSICYTNNKILDILIKYCSNDDAALTSLTLHRFPLTEYYVQRLLPIFGRLKCLKIEMDFISRNTDSILAACPNLVELNVTGVERIGSLAHRFKYLQNVELKLIYGFTNESMYQFCKLNKQIKSFTLTLNGDFDSDLFEFCTKNGVKTNFLNKQFNLNDETTY